MLSGIIEKMGATGRREFDRLAGSAETANRKMAGFGKTGLHMETLKRGAGQVATGLLMMTQNAEGTAGALGQMVSQGLGAFMAGGPVMAGLSVVTGLVGLLGKRSAEAAEQQRRLREEQQRAWEEEVKRNQEALKAESERRKKIEDRLQALRDETALLNAKSESERKSIENQQKLRDASGEDMALKSGLSIYKAELQRQGAERAAKERERQAKEAEASAERAKKDADAVKARDEAIAKAASDKRVALREQAEQYLRISQLTEEEAKHASQVEMIRRLQAAGERDLAGLVEARLRREIALEREKQAAEKEKTAAEKSERAETGSRRRMELLYASTDAERQAVEERQRYEDLVEAGNSAETASAVISAERYERERQTREEKEGQVQEIRHSIELLKAENEEARTRLEREQEIRRERREGHEEAVKALQERWRLEDEQAAKRKKEEQEAARETAQHGAGWTGSHMDKGLARDRAERRGALHMRKRRRELGARRYTGIETGEDMTVGPGGFGFGRAGGGASWFGAESDEDTDAETFTADFRGHGRYGRKRASRRGGAGAGAGPETAYKPPEVAYTPTGGAPKDSRDTVGGGEVRNLEEAVARHNEALKQTQDSLASGAKGMATGAEEARRMAEASTAVAESVPELTKAVEESASQLGRLADKAPAIEAAATLLEDVQGRLKKLEDGLDQLAKIVSGA
jgi:hypothetical protein